MQLNAMCRIPLSRSRSQTWIAHSSLRRAPLIATSHKYSASGWCEVIPAAITVAASWGEVASRAPCDTAGGLAESAGLWSIHSQRSAAVKAPDRMLWMFWIVFASSAYGRVACTQLVSSRGHTGGVSGWPLQRPGPTTVAVRPYRKVMRASPASRVRSCCAVTAGTPWSVWLSRTEGRASPGAGVPARIASLSVSSAGRAAARGPA
jgi:hypothetical protein